MSDQPFHQKQEEIHPSENVIITATVDCYGHEELDTQIRLTGEFCVSGQERKEFYKQLGELIDKYRI